MSAGVRCAVIQRKKERKKEDIKQKLSETTAPFISGSREEFRTANKICLAIGLLQITHYKARATVINNSFGLIYNISTSTVNNCSDEHAGVILYNSSLQQCRVTACFKTSTIISIPKKCNISRLDDDRPVTLTSVARKVLEQWSSCLAPVYIPCRQIVRSR